MAVAGLLKQAAESEIDSGNKFIIDFTNVKFIDSSGFGTLIALSHRLKANGQKLNLMNMSGNIGGIMNLSRRNEMFNQQTSLENFD